MNKIKFYVLILLSFSISIYPFGQREDKGNDTYKYNLDGFTGIHGTAAYDIEIKKADEFSVLIIADQSIEDKLVVEIRGDSLFLGVKTSFFDFNTKSPKAIITMPDLNEVVLSGASDLLFSGFDTKEDFHCKLSGSSSVNMDIKTNDIFFKLSGSSDIYGVLEADSVSIELSGSSDIELYGKAGNLDVSAQGSSSGKLNGFTIKDADIKLSGSSDLHLNMNGVLNINASGSSDLYYTGNVTLGDIDLSGSSTIKEE